jgi:hypothetical protein
MAPQLMGGWAVGRSSAELAQLFRTVALRQPWSSAEREQVLGFIDRNVIPHLQARSDEDREHWRWMYYALLLQCEASDESRRALAAPGPDQRCLSIRPGMP